MRTYEVDEDVFPELAKVQEVCFVIYTDDEFTFLHQGSEGPSSPSLTDTLSISTSSSQSDTSDAGCQIIQPTVEQILTSKPAGMTVIKEYEETGSLKDSTRRLMVNIIVAHMHEKEGRAVSKATKEFHALGIVSLFPSLKDPYSKKGYILQDFLLMFGAETASRFLEKWNTSFKDKVIQEARTLRETLGQRHGLSLCLAASSATDHLVKFHKSCQSLEDHLMTIEGNPQPYFLATGTSKAQVFSFYIVLDRKLLPCQSSTSLGAFVELFKSHFVFSVKYDDALSSLYTFLQTTLYNIDIGTTEETPKVKELRAKLLNKQ
ncbi:uncharacterized protein LOC134303857 [Trichomycterus rosablanca]|uniref:uncharacterized protein LOC134303857 n=1 Tax=Trichomycterus rosablanca TaxID=2290929 RepID=UPI002F354BAE